MQHSNIQSIAETNVCHATKVKTGCRKVHTNKNCPYFRLKGHGSPAILAAEYYVQYFTAHKTRRDFFVRNFRKK